MSKCHCDYCRGGREHRYDLNSIEDYDDTPRYRKIPKSSKFCKKSKTKEKCEFTVRVTRWSWTRTDEYDRTYETGSYVLACHRCGKHGPWFSFSTKKPYPPFKLY